MTIASLYNPSRGVLPERIKAKWGSEWKKESLYYFDRVEQVTNEESIEMARRLARYPLPPRLSRILVAAMEQGRSGSPGPAGSAWTM